MKTLLLSSLVLPLAMAASYAADEAKPAKVVLLAGTGSHGHGTHSHLAGMLILEKCLKGVEGIEPVVHDLTEGWPEDEVLEGAKAVALFSDGRGGHPFVRTYPTTGGKRPMDTVLPELMEKGVGLVLIHYAVDFNPKEEEKILRWMGGYYDASYPSQNPHNHDVTVTPEAKDHPIARGLEPFVATDEFYYNIHFRPEMAGVAPILSFVPQQEGWRKKQVIAWATERTGGGRSFGFTGGHFHKNWRLENFRKLVLNAIVWAAEVEVPQEGIECEVTEEDLKETLEKEEGKR